MGLDSVSRVRIDPDALRLIVEVTDSDPETARRVEWLVTRRGLFSVRELEDGNRALATDSDATNIHSHYTGLDSAFDGELSESYEFSGWMMATKRRGGIGVTIYSDYPRSDSYHRLRSQNGGSFHLAAHPDGSSVCRGNTDSGVRPRGTVWTGFRFQAQPEGSGTRLRAKVWREGRGEPEGWAIDCVTDGREDIVSGRPGVWSMGRGLKVWDDLSVTPLGEGAQ